MSCNMCVCVCVCLYLYQSLSMCFLAESLTLLPCRQRPAWPSGRDGAVSRGVLPAGEGVTALPHRPPLQEVCEEEQLSFMTTGRCGFINENTNLQTHTHTHRHTRRHTHTHTRTNTAIHTPYYTLFMHTYITILRCEPRLPYDPPFTSMLLKVEHHSNKRVPHPWAVIRAPAATRGPSMQQPDCGDVGALGVSWRAHLSGLDPGGFIGQMVSDQWPGSGA